MFNFKNNVQVEKKLFPNLVSNIQKKKLKELGNRAVMGYNTDVSSMSDEMIKKKENIAKLYALQRDPKNFPWENCSNVALPMLTMACAQFQARAFEELIPAKNIVREFPLIANADNKDIADRKTKYLNYHYMFKDKNFKKSMDTSMLKLGIEGKVIRKVFYDAETGNIKSDFLNSTDFVINENVRWLDQSPRHTQNHYWTYDQIDARIKSGFFKKVDRVLEERSIEQLDAVKLQHLKNLGLISTQDEEEFIHRRLILEQHVQMKLNDTDAASEPYILFIDYATEEVLRIHSNRNPLHPEDTLTHFIDYDFMPNPEGFWGYGFGLFLEGLNEALNSIVNMLIDSGVLQNLQTGVVLKKKGMKRGDVEISMGQFTEVDPGGSDDIRKIIQPFDFGSPSPVLFSLMGVIQQYSDRLTTVTEQQQGNAQKSDTTAHGVMALIEQGLKFFNSIHRRNHINFQREATAVERMYELYLDVEDYFNVVIDPMNDLVNPETGEEIPKEQTLAMLKEDFGTTNYIAPVSNPNIVSKQEQVAIAEYVFNTTVQSPVTSGNLQAIYEAHINLFETLGVSDADIQKFVPMPPQPQPPDLPQEEEIQMFMNEQYVEALETQNHAQHIQVIVEFEESDFFEQMSPKGKQMLDQHKRQHLGFQYILQAGNKVAQEQQ